MKDCACNKPIMSTMAWREILQNLTPKYQRQMDKPEYWIFGCDLCGREHRLKMSSWTKIVEATV